MEKFLIEKTSVLKGEIEIEGGKNAALPILAACLLCSGEVVLKRVPFLSDIKIMCDLLEQLGVIIKKDEQNKTLILNTENIKNTNISEELVKKIRASFLLAGRYLLDLKKSVYKCRGGALLG